MEDEIPDLIQTTPIEDEGTKRVPLTLICGFLGAGQLRKVNFTEVRNSVDFCKGTILDRSRRRILTERHGYRIAVIMNEFGDTADIESKAIKVSSADKPADSLDNASEEFLELPNGCLCCSIKDTGIAAIEKLMSRKGAFDHILLETTGLADPGPIAAMFWKNEEYAMGLGKDIYLDGVICVVDAVFAPKQIEQDEILDGIKFSLRQIGAADVILLNKTDLVQESELSKVENMIRTINSAAPIHRTSHSRVDLAKVMGIGAYSDGVRKILNAPAEEDVCSDHDHDHPHSHSSSFDGISNIIVHIPKPLKEAQITQLDGWIQSVLWEKIIPEHSSTSDLPLTLEVLRCKGIWWNENGKQFLLQGVRELYDISELPVTETDTSIQESIGKLVFIGRGLDNTYFEKVTLGSVVP
ncbi:hypothetical protein Clacol_009978 [Clathrus columnatus]|uniref:COBW domain-containing protein 1 n=1 Tax=Clathrus columnatus TaxID=1419009 RepID=A0AAV5AV27_9AGAM|nr:hypothetical protein Clacol_009978 [Clathrus columnatus]